jgi:hypothetical protein
MASVGGPTNQAMTISYEQLSSLDLERTARFGSETDKASFQNAVDWLKEQHAAGVANPTAPIPMPVNADDIGLAGAGLDAIFGFMDDSILEVMKTLHELGIVMRRSQQETRQATAESEVASQKASAQKIRDSAIFGLVSGIVGATTTIAGGLMSLKGAVQSLKMSMEPLKLEGIKGGISDLKARLQTMSPAELNQFKTTLDNAGVRAEALRQKWQAFSTLTQGGGQLVTAGLEFGGKEMDAQKAEIDAKTTMIHYIRENLDDLVRGSTELINDLRAKFNEFVQSRAQTERETSRFV